MTALYNTLQTKVNSERLRAVLTNSSWLIAEKSVRLLSQITVAVWVARYLGTGQYGVYSYALAYSSLFGFIAYLGLSGIVVRDLLVEPEAESEILGTAFTLRFLGALVALGLMVISYGIFGRQQYPLSLLLIAGLRLVFLAFESFDFSFQAQLKNRFTVFSKLLALLIESVITILLLIYQAPLSAFVIVLVFGSAVRAFLLLGFYLYVSKSHILQLRFTFSRARYFLVRSWPLILSSMGSLLYLKLDQVMLGNYVDEQTLGVYSVAVRLAEFWYFIPVIMGTTLMPIIVGSKHDDELYHRRLQRMYDGMFWLGMTIAVSTTLIAKPMVSFIFGAEYAGAAGILTVYIWTCPAVFLGGILSKWLISEDLYRFSLQRHMLGAAVNLLLNVWLIPLYGGMGAAFATLISYTTASYLACFSHKATWSAAFKMTLAITAPIRLLAFRQR